MAPRTSRAAGQGFSREDSGPCLTRTEKAWRRHVGACPAVHPRPAGWGLCSCDRRDSKAGPVLSRRRGRDRSGWSGRQAGRPLPPARHRRVWASRHPVPPRGAACGQHGGLALPPAGGANQQAAARARETTSQGAQGGTRRRRVPAWGGRPIGCSRVTNTGRPCHCPRVP